LRKGIRAFVLSAFAAAIMSLISLLIFSSTGQIGPLTNFDLRFFGVLLISFLAIASLSMLVVGLPLTFLLQKTKAERAWPYPVVGFLTGVAAAILYSELPLRGADWVLVALAGGLPGAVAGLIWWVGYRKAASTSSDA